MATIATNKKVDISNENLEYMRDLAEQEVINRYTTADQTILIQKLMEGNFDES